MKRHWIGPLLGWELVRLGRRGNMLVLRLGVGLLLLLALSIYYLVEYPTERDLEMMVRYSRWQSTGPADYAQIVSKLVAKFSESFNQYLLVLEVALVLLLTPIYIAGAIAEERDGKTLEFLLATDLGAGEILIGKLGSRLLQLSNVLLVCIPVIAILQVWGGVDIALVFAAFGIAVVGMVGTAAFSLSASLRGATLRGSLIRCYIPLVAFQAAALMAEEGDWFWGRGIVNFASPAVALIELIKNPAVLSVRTDSSWPTEAFCIGAAALVGANALATAFFLRDSTRNLRRLAFNSKPRKVVERRAENPDKRHWADPPKIPEDADGLYWKEKHFSGTSNRFVKSLSLLPAWLWTGIVVTTGMVGMTMLDGDLAAAAPILTKAVGLLFAFALLLIVGMAACASVARERQKETLVDLVMIPIGRRRILAAKWRGSLAQGRSLFTGFFAFTIVGATCLGISYLAVPCILLTVLAWACAAAAVGLWLSVRCRSVQRASGLWIVLMIAWFGGSYLIAKSLDIAYEIQSDKYGNYGPRRPRDESLWIDRETAAEMLVALSPAHAWDRVTFDIEESGTYNYFGRVQKLRDPLQLVAPAINLALHSALAFALWHLARRRFATETYK